MGNSAFSIDSLSFAYGRHPVLDNLALEIAEGKITTLIGANGCGKTTLLNLLTKNLRPDGGRIRLQGEDIAAIKGKLFARQVAIVHQNNTAPPDLTVETLVGYGRTPHRKVGGFGDAKADEEAIERALAVTHTAKHRKTPVSQLSGGQRQRVWIAMALAQETKILLLDEPTTFLDIRYQIQILRLIRQLNGEHGMTVVMVLHDINQSLYYSDELVAMKDGAVLAHGAPEDIVTPELIRAVFGIDLPLAHLDGKPFIPPV